MKSRRFHSTLLLLSVAGACFISTLHAQTPFPKPDSELEFRPDDIPKQREALKKLGPRYAPLWQTGKARWKELEARFHQAAKCYGAVVEKMDFAPDGSSCDITFRAWFESRVGSLQSPTFSIGPPPPSNDEVLPPNPIIQGGRVFILKWTRADNPPPFATGCSVNIGVDAGGSVICADHPVYDISAVRLNPEGRIEVILQVEKLLEKLPPAQDYLPTEPSKKLIRVRPDFTNLELAGDAIRLTNVLWDLKGGIAVLALGEEAADDMTESMIGLSERRGVPVENEPKFRFLIGSDGWRRYKDLPRNVGRIGFEYLIPPDQFITIKDGFEDLGLDFTLETLAAPAAASVWVFPDSGSRLLTAADLKPLNADQLWKAKNEIYARHGYLFSTQRGRIYAASLGDACVGRSADQEAVAAEFNDYEKKNVALIATFMK